ncbi:MAG TPA: hypothetical protein VFO41_12435 [Alphaproteobacteria bacterium]|nr:hypothetical protein [Alphaproteobacteria bacterium]
MAAHIALRVGLAVPFGLLLAYHHGYGAELAIFTCTAAALTAVGMYLAYIAIKSR